MVDNSSKTLHNVQNKLEDVANDVYEVGYEEGLNGAWDCIRKIIGLGEPLEIVQSAGLRNFICKYTAAEAIEKLKEYEAHHLDCTKFPNELAEKTCDNCNNWWKDDKCNPSCIRCKAHDNWVPKQFVNPYSSYESSEPKFILYMCPNCSRKWRVIPGLLDNEICPNCGYKVHC